MKRLFALATGIALMTSTALAANLSAEKSANGVVIRIDGKLFTEYHTRAGSKPVLWPIIGPDERRMTREYPMAKKEGEREDHIHQRSQWFTHGEVNGVDFWAEVGKNRYGLIRHRQFDKIAGGGEAVVATTNDWLNPEGGKELEDKRMLTFGVRGAARWIDFMITLVASEKPVVFGDTKEGSFGVRVSEEIKVDAKKGGRIVNSAGQVDAEAWGKRADWVDYHGPIDGKRVGIAIMNHPSSFRYPTWWHVRTYGLFAANPFGPMSFEGKKDGPAFTLEKGKSLSLRYLILVHAGDEREGEVAAAYAAYTDCKKAGAK